MIPDNIADQFTQELIDGHLPALQELTWGFWKTKSETNTGEDHIEDFGIVTAVVDVPGYVEFIRSILDQQSVGLRWEGDKNRWWIQPTYRFSPAGPPILGYRLEGVAWVRQIEGYRLRCMNSLWGIGTTYILVLGGPGLNGEFDGPLGVAFSNKDEHLEPLSIDESISVVDLTKDEMPDFQDLEIIKSMSEVPF